MTFKIRGPGISWSVGLEQNVEREGVGLVLLGFNVPNVRVSGDTFPLTSTPSMQTPSTTWLCMVMDSVENLHGVTGQEAWIRIPYFYGQVVSVNLYVAEFNSYLQNSILQNWIHHQCARALWLQLQRRPQWNATFRGVLDLWSQSC